MIVPHGIDGRAVAAGHGVIHHIVVDKGGVMEKLNGGGGGKDIFVDLSENLGAHDEH